MYEECIATSRLELHHIPANGLVSLFEEKKDDLAIAGRGLRNPHRTLVDDSGPLAWRVPEVKADESVNKWFVRFIVLKENQEIIGSTSFHNPPDENGMIEIGLGIEKAFWNQGYAKEALLGMWNWVIQQPGVKTLRYTVSPENAASIKVIEHFGFTYQGQQMDEIDGPENIYEMTAVEFSRRWGGPHDR